MCHVMATKSGGQWVLPAYTPEWWRLKSGGPVGLACNVPCDGHEVGGASGSCLHVRQSGGDLSPGGQWVLPVCIPGRWQWKSEGGSGPFLHCVAVFLYEITMPVDVGNLKCR
jgi:hypothetical protein